MPVYTYSCDACKHDFDAYVHFTTSTNQACEKCGGPTEKVWTVSQRNGYSSFPYKTRNITADGSEVEVTSAAHEKQLMQEYTRATGAEIRKRDDAAFIDKEYRGYDWKTKTQRYEEGSGVGRPGCWSSLPSGMVGRFRNGECIAQHED